LLNEKRRANIVYYLLLAVVLGAVFYALMAIARYQAGYR